MTLLFLVLAVPMRAAITIDTTASADQGTASPTVTIPAFSTTSGNELLLAFISSDAPPSDINTSVTGVTGAGLIWVRVVRTNVQFGPAEIWRAFANTPLTNVSVTATISHSVASSMTVMSFAGVDTTGTNGSGAIGAIGTGNANPGVPIASLTTTRNNSWVFGVGTDFDNLIARTVTSGQTIVHQFLAASAGTFWMQRQNSPTTTAGTVVSISDTAPTGDRFNLSICEILPAQGPTYSVSGNLSPAGSGSGATVKLSVSGTTIATTTADASGNYTFTGLANGNYTVTPSKSGFTFTPPNQAVTINGANAPPVNFTAQPVPTYSISGVITPAASGSGTTVTLSGAFSTSTTADASGNYTFTGLANGSYTVTPSKSGFTFTPPNQAVTINGANAPPVNFTAQIVVGITIDTTASADQGTASPTVTIPAFSTTSGNELLLAFISSDAPPSDINTSVTGVTGAGLIWVRVVRTNVQFGPAEIWRAFANTPLTNVSVTATISHSVASSMTVMSFAGVDTTGTNGSGAIGAIGTGNANPGVPIASLTTTRNNSWVFGVGTDFDNLIARTVTSGQTIVHQFLAASAGTFWMQRQNSPTTTAGTVVSISDTAPTGDRFNLSICEILPAQGPTYSVSGNLSPAGSGSGATVKLSVSGTTIATTTADASGNYTFTGLANGNYTVTPSKSGFTFTPPNQAVTINGANAPPVNFTAQPVPTYSISGVITPAASGSGTTVTLSGAFSTSTTADASGNYTFTGLANGSYTVTPSKSGFTFTPPNQAVTINGANAPPVNFTAQIVVGITIDTTASADQGTASPTVTIPAFSTTSGNELLLAFISSDALVGTVTSVTGAGLTWVPVIRSNAQYGPAEIWRAFANTPLTNVSVTATLSSSVASSITLMSFAGVDTTGTNGSGAIGATGTGNSSSGAPSASLITMRNNSWVFGVGTDWNAPIARTVGANQVLIHQALPISDTFWVQRQLSTTPSAGAVVTINDTTPTTDRYNLAIVEILASLSGAGTPTPPTVSMASPAPNARAAGMTTVSANAADTSGSITGVQFLLDGANLGSQVTGLPPYSITWDTSMTTAGTHALSAVAYSSTGLSTRSNPITVTVDNSGNPAVVGSWSSVVELPTVAVNLILLNNKNVLFFQDGLSPTVWDYVNNRFTSIPITANVFCSGHAALADGRILVVGGFGGSESNHGIAKAEIFDPANNTWTTVPAMAYPRWYPTATTMSDGRVLVTAGWQTTDHSNAGIPEIYDPVTNSWTQLTTANNPFESYPFIYVLSDGRVIHVGGSEYGTVTETLDLNTQTWSSVDARILDAGSASMYLPGKIMKAGSAIGSMNVGPSSNTTFVLDMTQPSPMWQQTPSMAYPRSFLNLTTLPDGTVLATGGETDKIGGNINAAVYAAELWSPQTETWTTMASMKTPREYHSTALLLPDGRVLVSGMGADFGQVPDQKSAEFYSPPYLFKGTRPTITQAPAGIHYGQNLFVGTPDGATITSAVLIRTGAVTHFFDQNTRFVPVAFTQTTGGLMITAPANGNQAPPGHYMLFLVNNSGVPSVAPIIQLTR
jgi:hypothetical protein